jgi:hypothetical protein
MNGYYGQYKGKLVTEIIDIDDQNVMVVLENGERKLVLKENIK